MVVKPINRKINSYLKPMFLPSWFSFFNIDLLTPPLQQRMPAAAAVTDLKPNWLFQDLISPRTDRCLLLNKLAMTERG